MSTHGRKQILFDIGREAFQKLTGRTDVGYVCPICLGRFPNLQGLSEEHVPPAALGGKVLCLTCQECNSAAGHRIDTHIHREQISQSFMEKTGQTRRATLIKNGHQLNVDVRHDNQGINISILGEHNNPRVVEILQPRDILSGTSLQLRDRVSYSQTKADIGHLKSAYLAAFAKLGYAYILRRELNSVRQQIISPETQELGLLRLEARDGSNIQNDLFLFQSPVRCLGIKMGNVIICLPVDSEGLYEKLQEMRSVGWKETWQIKERCDWPDRFELALDFSGRYRIE